MASDTRLIDLHAHYIPDFLLDALNAAGRSPALSGFPSWSPRGALDAMDRSGIGTSVLSVSTPGVHFGDDTAARRLARQCNDYCARLREDHPGRFGAFAALPLPDVEGARREIAYALDELKLEGVGLLASYGDLFLGAPELDPVLDELNARKAVAFVHPAGHPSSRSLKLASPLWLVEYPIDTTRAAVNLIMTGAIDRFPDIRFVLAHAGGALPYLAWRVSAAPLIDHRYRHLTREAILGAIRGFYYEVAQASGEAAFGALQAVADPRRILFGSDWPYCSENVTAAIRKSLDDVRTISEETRAGVERENARLLFPGLS